MFTQRKTFDGFKVALIVALLGAAVLGPVSSMAGGLLLYEVGTADGGYAVGSDGCLPGDVDGSYDDTGAIIHRPVRQLEVLKL